MKTNKKRLSDCQAEGSDYRTEGRFEAVVAVVNLFNQRLDNPDGTLSTEINGEYIDENGFIDIKKMDTEMSIRILDGITTEMLKAMPRKTFRRIWDMLKKVYHNNSGGQRMFRSYLLDKQENKEWTKGVK